MAASKRIAMIDYIKGVCIIMVIVMHCDIHTVAGKMLLMPFYVDLAVPCFLLVSGYTLSLRTSKRINKSLNFLDTIKKSYQLKKIYLKY